MEIAEELLIEDAYWDAERLIHNNSNIRVTITAHNDNVFIWTPITPDRLPSINSMILTLGNHTVKRRFGPRCYNCDGAATLELRSNIMMFKRVDSIDVCEACYSKYSNTKLCMYCNSDDLLFWDVAGIAHTLIAWRNGDYHACMVTATRGDISVPQLMPGTLDIARKTRETAILSAILVCYCGGLPSDVVRLVLGAFMKS